MGVIFFGSEGYMIIPDYSSYYVFLGPGRELGPHAASTKPQRARDVPGMVSSIMDLPHFQNWIAACRSRKHEDLNADVEQGHLSMAICHLAKISNHLKRSVRFDPKTERFVNDDEANRLLKREYRAALRGAGASVRRGWSWVAPIALLSGCRQAQEGSWFTRTTASCGFAAPIDKL